MLQTDLLPVQIHYLSNPKKLKVYDVIGILLKDLTLRQIIYYHNVSSFPNQLSRKRQKYGMIMQGSKFHEYYNDNPPLFEKLFLSPLEEIPRIQLRILSDYVIKRYNMPSQFIQVEIQAPLMNDGLMSGPPVLKSFGMFSATTKGKEEAEKFNQHMSSVHEKISSTIKADDNKFIATIEECGIYALILKHTDHELYEEMYERTDELVKKLQPTITNYLNIFHAAMIIEVGAHAEDH